MKASQVIASSRTRVLVMGLPGSGKSTLVAALAEEGFRLTWISLDNDVDVLKKLSPAAQENVNVFNIPDSAAFPVGCDTLLKLFREQKGAICTKHGVWKCAVCTKAGDYLDPIDLTTLGPKDIVVIDTATQLGHSILSHVTKGSAVDAKPERDDWGALRKYTEFFCSQFQAARFNLAVICHVVEAELEDARTKLVPNFGSKGMSAEFAKAFSHVVYTEVVNKKHKAFSSSTATTNVLTKSRTDFAIESLPTPSLAPIFQGQESIPESPPVIQPKTEVSSTPTVESSEKKSATDLLARLKHK